MGWRISLYCVPKKTVEKYKDVTQEEYNKKWEEINDEFEKDQIKYDTLTDKSSIFGSLIDQNDFVISILLIYFSVHQIEASIQTPPFSNINACRNMSEN